MDRKIRTWHVWMCHPAGKTGLCSASRRWCAALEASSSESSAAKAHCRIHPHGHRRLQAAVWNFCKSFRHGTYGSFVRISIATDGRKFGRTMSCREEKLFPLLEHRWHHTTQSREAFINRIAHPAWLISAGRAGKVFGAITKYPTKKNNGNQLQETP